MKDMKMQVVECLEEFEPKVFSELGLFRILMLVDLELHVKEVVFACINIFSPFDFLDGMKWPPDQRQLCIFHPDFLVTTSKMVRMNVLSECLNTIVLAERAGKRQVLIRPSSKVVVRFLRVMQQQGYIGEFEVVDDHRMGKIVIELNGRINKCGVISPRFDVPLEKVENWVTNLLPARQFGCLVLSTSDGIMSHEEARRRGTGGKILGYFY
ncbi:putative 40S ribosomal protein S15a [Blattamonas nauphoetae]|uniref:40S ribosomal protein S15a n=1 Tax=Blattamonas nauphoetae TaxID=2049346 RepID=A0ABQ9X905_9EUKA|nr:putative 40S ribosomal protein S15a [Blattamonas nauphoetae]